MRRRPRRPRAPWSRLRRNHAPRPARSTIIPPWGSIPDLSSNLPRRQWIARLVEPEVRRSVNGVLQTTLSCRYAYKDIGGQRLYLRSYEGASYGPRCA